MSSINNEQKKLIFDFCLGQITARQQKEVQDLISSNQEASEIYSKLKSVFNRLDYIEFQDCPESLVDSTLEFVNEHINSGQTKLQALLETEQYKSKPLRIGLWRNFSEMAAVAAAILLIVGVLVPTFGVARQQYFKNICQSQLSNIYMGFNNYMQDNNGEQPEVTTASGSPWFKVGSQAEENHSNTRHIFLLVKYNYVEINHFTCPGNRDTKSSDIDTAKLRKYRDFPDRNSVTYSFRISCTTKEGKLYCRKVILSDLNPLFEQLPSDFSKPFNLQLERKLLTVNSPNHNRSGQNVLFGDGSVEFRKTRSLNNGDDDIFTLQDTDIYHGYETPSSPTDSFLAP